VAKSPPTKLPPRTDFMPAGRLEDGTLKYEVPSPTGTTAKPSLPPPTKK
jgi:hypothetical protein